MFVRVERLGGDAEIRQLRFGYSDGLQDARGVPARGLRDRHAPDRFDFRTRGRYSSTTADGTVWLTKDTCTTTTTVVSRGQVEVDDFGRDKTTTVSAGERYKAGASS